jgi:pimeloyl-ACP methyl ester carboxylesterase
MQTKINLLISILVLLAALTACQTTKVEPISGDTIGILLMHGGLPGTPYYSRGLGSKLRSAGIVVRMPLMPWGKGRAIDKGYEESMVEIDTYVADLKKAGAKRIFVAGHSFGANVALGYAARREGLSGVILLAHGHTPESLFSARFFGHVVTKAQAMIDAGNGESSARFTSSYGNFYGTANDILSWFDPYGPAATRFNAHRVKPNTPVLCIEGKYAEFEHCINQDIFSSLPGNPYSRYALVNANHLDTPLASFNEIIDWLRKL